MSAIDKLVGKVFSAQINRALRAEADLETAIELLKNADKEAVHHARAAFLYRFQVERAHAILDETGVVSPRGVSHKGLATRIRKLVDAWRRAKQPNLIVGLKPTYWFHDEVQK